MLKRVATWRVVRIERAHGILADAELEAAVGLAGLGRTGTIAHIVQDGDERGVAAVIGVCHPLHGGGRPVARRDSYDTARATVLEVQCPKCASHSSTSSFSPRHRDLLS